MKKASLWLIGLFLLLLLENAFLLWLHWPPYFMRQEQLQEGEENTLKSGEIWVITPSGPFKHVPLNDFSLNFHVRVYRHQDWHMWGNCFDQTIYIRHDSKYIYSHMLSSSRDEVNFEGPLDHQALVNGYCYFYISIESAYLPNLDGNTIYPPADFQITGIPKKEIGQEQRMQRLEKLIISLTSRKDPHLDVPLPITVSAVVGDECPNPDRYRAGSLVFKVEIPQIVK